jgi:hypothetical protein
MIEGLLHHHLQRIPRQRQLLPQLQPNLCRILEQDLHPPLGNTKALIEALSVEGIQETMAEDRIEIVDTYLITPLLRPHPPVIYRIVQGISILEAEVAAGGLKTMGDHHQEVAPADMDNNRHPQVREETTTMDIVEVILMIMDTEVVEVAEVTFVIITTTMTDTTGDILRILLHNNGIHMAII